MMKDYSIEYSHIYTNEKISEEHEISLTTLKGIQEDLNKKNNSFALAVLVDDYSFPEYTFDYDAFMAWLTKEKSKPDTFLRESSLIPVCDEVLARVNNKKLHKQIKNYIKINRYPCSLFISAWYLLRLGYLKADFFDKKYSAKNLINILPKRFKPFEDKAFDIIKATEFSEAGNVIKDIYI